MAHARQELEQKRIRDTALFRAAQTIDTVISELPFVVSSALGESLEKKYFDFLWEKWISFDEGNQFTLDELNRHYQNLDKQLPELTEEFRNQHRFDRDAISSSKEQLIVRLVIDLHYILLGARLGVAQFMDAGLLSHTPSLIRLNQELFAKIEDGLSVFPVEHLRSARQDLACLLGVLSKRLLDAAYIKFDKVPLLDDERNLIEEGYVRSLDDALRDNLPTIGEMNAAIHLMTGDESNKRRVAQGRDALYGFKNRLSFALKELESTLEVCLACESQVQALFAKHNEVRDVFKKSKAFTDLVQLTSQIEHLDNTAKSLLFTGNEVADTSESQKLLPRALYHGDWSRLATYVRKNTTELSEILGKAAGAYGDFYDQLASLRDMPQHFNPLMELQMHEVTLLATRLAQARDFIQLSMQRIQENHDELEAHLEGSSTATYLKSFVSRHWPKILTGGIGGVGGGVGLGFLLTMTQPAPMALLCLSNMVLGGTLGVGVGMALDTWRGKGADSEVKPQEPLLDATTILLALQEPSSTTSDDRHDDVQSNKARSGWFAWR